MHYISILPFYEDRVSGRDAKNTKSIAAGTTVDCPLLYLRAGSTYESIAGELGVASHNTIRSIVDNVKTGTTSQIDKEWNLSSKDENHNTAKPFRYNIWKYCRIGKFIYS